MKDLLLIAALLTAPATALADIVEPPGDTEIPALDTDGTYDTDEVVALGEPEEKSSCGAGCSNAGGGDVAAAAMLLVVAAGLRTRRR